MDCVIFAPCRDLNKTCNDDGYILFPLGWNYEEIRVFLVFDCHIASRQGFFDLTTQTFLLIDHTNWNDYYRHKNIGYTIYKTENEF